MLVAKNGKVLNNKKLILVVIAQKQLCMYVSCDQQREFLIKSVKLTTVYIFKSNSLHRKYREKKKKYSHENATNTINKHNNDKKNDKGLMRVNWLLKFDLKEICL